MGLAKESTSVYALIGGSVSIKVIVDDLYDRVVSDERLSKYFINTDIDRLKSHLRGFISAAGGGPEIYTGRSMSDAHATVGVTPEDFDRLIGHLADSLTELAAHTSIIGELGAQLYSLRDEIAPRTPACGGVGHLPGHP